MTGMETRHLRPSLTVMHKAACCDPDPHQLTTHRGRNDSWRRAWEWAVTAPEVPSFRQQRFQHVMAPAAGRQDCLQLASLRKTFSRLSRLSSQINFLSTHVTPLPVVLLPSEALRREFLLDTRLLEVLVTLWQTLQWPHPSSPELLPSPGQKGLENLIPALLTTGHSGAGLPSGPRVSTARQQSSSVGKL